MANASAVEQPSAAPSLNPATELAQLLGATAWCTDSIFLSVVLTGRAAESLP